ncbi:MAG: YeeE/YedE thiosulfate transporter family protein [Scandinavium sp.]|uniref:YeeE/YedE thiosulfate transporter family protein n=1 Tax=Scandinavium sp. TaxID=2830653 RepID=UPI003F33B5B6
MPSDVGLILLLMISGWMVQRGGFCLVAAVSLLMEKRPERLLLILGVALVAALLSLHFQSFRLFSPSGMTFWCALSGAALFGVGAALNRGCFFGTLSKLAKGDGHMLLTLGGMMGIAAVLPPYPAAASSFKQGHPPILLCLMLLVLCATGWLQRRRKDRLRSLVRLLIPGLTFGLIYSANIGWSLSRLITDVWYVVRYDEILNKMRMAGFIAFLMGMLLYHLYYKDFVFIRLSAAKGVRHFCGGTIMMIGSRMMGGGNDNFLFSKLPSLTPAIFILLLAMLTSILITTSLLYGLVKNKCG